MSDAFYLGGTKDTYLGSPKGVYLASPKHTYLSSPRFYLSSPQSRSQAGKKLWRLEIRTMIRSPDSYAARFLAEVEEMDKGPRELPMGKGSTGSLETLTLIPVKFIPKYRPRYRPVDGPRYQPNLRRVFQPRWEALIQRRRLQRHAYTPEELEERRPGLVERWRERHEKWAEEAKVHEKAMKVQPRYMSYALIPRYRPAYRSVYRPMYSPKQRPKPKYTCAECRTSYLWLNDFLAHIKSDHRGKRPLRLPPGLSRLGKEEP